jgi:hypothetical protein
MPRNHSPIDWKKIMEGRSIVNDPDLQDAPNHHKMFILFEKRPDLAEGLSTNELALILFPTEIYHDKKKKRDLPTRFAYDKAERYIQILNGWLLNKSQVVYSMKDKDGCWRYFNKQKMKQFANSELHAKNIIKGIESKQERAKKIIKIPDRIKQKYTSETRHIIKIAAINRRRKSKDGDSESFYG